VALSNFLAFQGWNPGGEKELYTMLELTESFSLERIQKSGARWNPVKLEWFNKEYIKQLSDTDTTVFKSLFFEMLPISLKNTFDENFSSDLRFVCLFSKYIERISYISQIKEEPLYSELCVLSETPTIDMNLIYGDLDHADTQIVLKQVFDILTDHTSDWQPDNLKLSLEGVINEKGTKNTLHPLRTALSGQKKSLDPFSLLTILGKNESLSRIELVLKKMNSIG
jgi:glutamyl-tRNA synthetase